MDDDQSAETETDERTLVPRDEDLLAAIENAGGTLARRAGRQAGPQTGVAIGKRAVGRAKDAGRVIEAIERTHTRTVGTAVSKPRAIQQVAAKVKGAADQATAEARHAGGIEQLKGHFIEILDIDAYNAKNRLTGNKLVPRLKGNAEAYDASRFIDKRFAGGVQQKSSASHIEKTIKAMEKKKLGSARKGVLRVPKDQVDTAARRTGRRVKEVKGMDFTLQEATGRLEKSVNDVARKGTKAASQARALGKAGATGALISAVVGGLTDIPAVRRREIDGRDYAENRAVDAAEGATGAALGTAAAGMGAAGATAALGTAAGASFAASAGAAGTAALSAVGGMGTAGAAVAGALGGVTATAALPAIAGAGAAIGTGMFVTKRFKRVRSSLLVRQQQRKQLAVPSAAHQLSAARTGVDEIAAPET